MENKVLVKIIVPEIDEEFDVFFPVNEVIWKIEKMVTKIISDLSNINFELEKKYAFLNKYTQKIYDTNEILINTDIRNGTELILININ